MFTPKSAAEKDLVLRVLAELLNELRGFESRVAIAEVPRPDCTNQEFLDWRLGRAAAYGTREGISVATELVARAYRVTLGTDSALPQPSSPR